MGLGFADSLVRMQHRKEGRSTNFECEIFPNGLTVKSVNYTQSTLSITWLFNMTQRIAFCIMIVCADKLLSLCSPC